MNLDMFWPKIETSMSITGNCEMPNNQTHEKPQQTLGKNLTHPKHAIFFSPPSNHGP